MQVGDQEVGRKLIDSDQADRSMPDGAQAPQSAQISKEQFVNLFGSVFEHSPWIAERAWAQGSNLFPITALSIFESLSAVFWSSRREERMAVLLAHPDLAGRLAYNKSLTPESTEEQNSAGLDNLTLDERVVFTKLNQSYVEKFGFPFIIAVMGLSKSQILDAFKKRLNNTGEQEFDTACQQVERIAELRIERILGAG